MQLLLEAFQQIENAADYLRVRWMICSSGPQDGGQINVHLDPNVRPMSGSEGDEFEPSEYELGDLGGLGAGGNGY